MSDPATHILTPGTDPGDWFEQGPQDVEDEMYKAIYNVCHNIVDGSEVPAGSKWARCEDSAWRACPDDKPECFGSESTCRLLLRVVSKKMLS